MKKIIKYLVMVAIVALASCTSYKQAVPTVPPTVHKSYKIPACHKAMHEELLKNQQKMILTTFSE